MNSSIRYYDRYSKAYDSRSPYHYMLESIEKNAISECLSGGITLDLGCGTGRFFDILSIYGTVIGLDFSKGMIKKARERKKNNIHLIRASATNLPFKNGIFDNVVSFKTIPHMEPASVLKEIGRISKKNILLEFYNTLSFRKATYKFSKQATTFFLTYWQAKKLVESVGFESKNIYGARTFTALAILHNIPAVSKILYILEHTASKSFLKIFAGNIIIYGVKKWKE